MSIATSCLSCGKNLDVPDKYAGKRIKCPSCENPITVPAASAPPPPESERVAPAAKPKESKLNPTRPINDVPSGSDAQPVSASPAIRKPPSIADKERNERYFMQAVLEEEMERRKRDAAQEKGTKVKNSIIAGVVGLLLIWTIIVPLGVGVYLLVLWTKSTTCVAVARHPNRRRNRPDVYRRGKNRYKQGFGQTWVGRI
jgi:hypothetical protein